MSLTKDELAFYGIYEKEELPGNCQYILGIDVEGLSRKKSLSPRVNYRWALKDSIEKHFLRRYGENRAMDLRPISCQFYKKLWHEGDEIGAVFTIKFMKIKRKNGKRTMHIESIQALVPVYIESKKD